MSHTRKITFVTHSGQVREPDTGLLNVAARLSERGVWAPSYLSFSHGPLEQACSDRGIECRVVEMPDALLRPGQDALHKPGGPGQSIRTGRDLLEKRSALADVIYGMNPDVVCTTGSKAHLAGGAAARFAQKKLIWYVARWYHDARVRFLTRVGARYMPHATVFCSRFAASQFYKRGRTNVVYPVWAPAAEQTESPAEELCKALGIPPDAPKLATFVEPGPAGGHALFLRAAARIIEDIPDAYFLVPGELIYYGRDITDALRDLATDYGIYDRVIFTGADHAPEDVLRLAHVYVHATARPEPFGGDIVLAMQLGLPVAASGWGGAEEIVRHLETGALVEPEDTVSMARAVVQLLDNHEVAQAFGGNGKQRAHEHFNPDNAAAKFENILEKTVS